MDHFEYRDGTLHAEGVPVARIADAVGTPAYVYSAATFRRHVAVLREAFSPADPLLCYSVKANGNLAVLKLLADEGCGFDVVSGGELHRVRAAGGDPAKTVFAGVGKGDTEIAESLAAGIRMFNVESEAEIENLDRIARGVGTVAPVAIRINPDVDPRTHRYITTGKRETKFGLDPERSRALLERAGTLPGIRIEGLHLHIGSQITDPAPYVEALARTRDFIKTVRKHLPDPFTLNLGGGFGIHYRGREGLPPDRVAPTILEGLPADARLILEPGRFIAGNAGILLVTVLYVKEGGGKRFAICDAGMNALIRPALYEAFHHVGPIESAHDPRATDPDGPPPEGTIPTDVVGPICETADFLALDRPLSPVARGDRLAVFGAGAYGFVMASQYNGHPRPPEVLVDGDGFRIVRDRETVEDLVRNERT